MKFLIRISLRNLFRQKRRNLLLGSAIAIGMSALVIANAFSHGISDIMFNRILTYVTGHVSVAFSEKGNYNKSIFRDGDRLMKIARTTLPSTIRIEEAVGVFSRMIGNGVSDNVILIGIDMRSEATEKEKAQLKENFPMYEGNFEDILRKDLEYPIIISFDKAKFLKVKSGDIVRARFQDVHGRNQAVRLSVAGIFKPANIFMNAPVFMDLKRLKHITGYTSHDVSGFQITLSDPKNNAVISAELLHAALKPPIAIVPGNIFNNISSLTSTTLGFKVDSISLINLANELGIKNIHSKSVLIGSGIAEKLQLDSGKICSLSYAKKHDSGFAKVRLNITGIIPHSNDLPANLILVNDRAFYDFYYKAWPAQKLNEDFSFKLDSNHGLYPYVLGEWKLLDRSHTTDEMKKKYRAANRLKTKATLVDVQSMYETASMILKLEYALNLITLSTVLILFFIIQVGVVNTLRMTIKERTREIGTMRAIGMQSHEVRSQFLLETFFLSIFSCFVGILLAFLGMVLLKQIPFTMEGNPLGMLLVNGRLHFMPTWLGILLYLLLILAIAAFTAWFPARKAAKLSPSEALRHFG